MDDTVTELQFGEDDQYRDLDLSGIEVSEAEPLVVGTPDPKKSKREKPEKEKPEKERKSTPRYTPGKYVKPVTEMYGFVAMGVGMIGDQQCAQVIMANAENCAEAWDKAAKESPAIRRALQTLVESTTVSILAIAHLPIAAAILSHHKPGLIPEPFRISSSESEVNNSDDRAA